MSGATLIEENKLHLNTFNSSENMFLQNTNWKEKERIAQLFMLSEMGGFILQTNCPPFFCFFNFQPLLYFEAVILQLECGDVIAGGNKGARIWDEAVENYLIEGKLDGDWITEYALNTPEIVSKMKQ